MRLVFWQNILSPHQLPYISCLHQFDEVTEVVVVSAEQMLAERAEMGWELGQYPGLEFCKVVVAPDEKVVDALLSEKQAESIHLFSGIHGFPFIFHALKESMRYNVRRGMITELPLTYYNKKVNGRPIWMHRLRFWLQDLEYARKMDFCFSMGSKAADYFKSVYTGWNVIQFAYCTDSKVVPHKNIEGNPKILFVGSLIHRKGVDVLIKAFIESGVDAELDIIGDGEERKYLEELASENKNIHFLGTHSQTVIPGIMASHDVLVLPSRHDGWGAVVNEALTQGLYVIVSDACGTADIPYSSSRLGQVFKNENASELSVYIRDTSENIETIRQDNSWRMQWVEANITGMALAAKMVNVLTDN